MWKRWYILLLCACLVMTLLAGTWVSAKAVAFDLLTPTPDDFDATATYLVEGVTATAYARTNLDSSVPFPTQVTIDPFEITATALVIDSTQKSHDMTATANPIDPIYVTSTFIVGRATQIQSFYETMTANPVDPIYITATAVVAQATQMQFAYMTATAGGTLATLFPTIAPTLSAVDRETLRASWRADIEKAAGFSHTSFDDITYELMFGCCGLDYSRDDLQSHLAIDVEWVTYENDDYVALVVHRLHTVFGSQVWVFRLRDGVPSLVFANYQVSSMGSLNFYPAFSDIPPVGFDDFNGNSFPDIAIENGSGGSCGYQDEILLEIQPNGEVVNIVPDLGASRTDWTDINNDDVLEIEANWIASDIPIAMNHCSSSLTRYYGWDGTAYRDISASLDESHWPAIGQYFDTSQVDNGCLLPDVPMYWMLLGYQAMGRLEEEWQSLQAQLRWNKCSPEILVDRGEDMGKFLIWVGTHLQEEKQYKSQTSSSLEIGEVSF